MRTNSKWFLLAGCLAAVLGGEAAVTKPTLTIGTPQSGTVTLKLSNVTTNLALVAAYGRADASTVLRRWDHVDVLGVIAKGTTSYTYALPADWGDQVGALRFAVAELANLPVAFLDGATMDQSGNGASKPQWFDAGVTAAGNIRCVVDWTPTEFADKAEWLFWSATKPAFEMYKNPAGCPGFVYAGNGYNTQTSWAPSEVGVRSTWVLDGRTLTMSRDEDTVIKITSNWSGTGGNLVIGRGASSNPGVRGTIHGVKVWQEWTPLRDFVPAQTLAPDGSRVTGFYDKVGGVFRASGGSAPFVAGSEIAWKPEDLGNVVVLATSSALKTSVQTQTPHVAKWRGDRAGAITYTFDDGYAEHYTVVEPKLREHGFLATFFVIPGSIGKSLGEAKALSWTQVKDLVAKGHDIGNHGYSSYYHRDYARAKIKEDTWAAQTNIEAKTGYRPVSFAHPNVDVVGFSDAVIAECGLKYTVIDRYFLGGDGVQIGTTAAMDAVVDDAVNEKAWRTFIAHGITSGYGAWTSSTALLTHLDHTAANSKVWVDSMAHVGAYEKLYKATSIAVEKVGDDDYRIRVTPPDFPKSECDGTLDIVNTRGETREFDPYAGDFNLTNGEIVYPPADRLARVRLRDWMGKDLGSVTGVVLGTSFSIDAKNYFNGTVDYVTAFDGGTVAKASSDTYASGSKVTWKDIGDGLETEIFIQPRVPYPAEPRYGMADPWIVKDPKKNTWYSLITSGTSLKYRPNTSFPTADWGVTGGKGETTLLRFAEHPDEFGEYWQNCWAPEMHYIRGSWYIYTSLTRTDTDDTQRIHCLKLDGDDITSTTGWHLAKRFVTPGTKDTDKIAWAIDATVLDDTDASGRMWLIWSGWPSVNNQNLYMAELATPTSFVANASRVLLSQPTESWERLNRKVNEGPVVLRHGNATHVVYSCNGCASDYYSLALLTCTNGDYGVASSWKKHDGRIFVTRKTAYGPGHCSFTKDAAGNEYVVYHAKYKSVTTDDYYKYRDMRVQPIAWHGDFPVLGAPRPFEGTTDSFNANADYTKADADRRTVVHCPSSLIEAVEYTGEAQSPSWARYASVTVVSGGTRTEPGTNTVTLALADTTRYVWSDGTTANKTAKFAILPSAQAHEHAWGEWKTAVSPGCETDGYEVRVCMASGCTVPAAAETNAIAALGHDWGDWVIDVEPQVGVTGHKYRDCSRCPAHGEAVIASVPTAQSAVTTNAMPNAGWGFEVRGLGAATDEVAYVFTNTATTVDWTLPEGVSAVRYLIAGGGASGGACVASSSNKYYAPGGGGAGGLLESNDCPVTSRNLTVTVGAGGAARSVTGEATSNYCLAGQNGKNSTLDIGDGEAIVAYGGGGGGDYKSGAKGGSGGGSGTSYSGPFKGGACYEGQGNVGGSSAKEVGAAGGGGAGAAGANKTSGAAGGAGGAGKASDILGAENWYCAGGGGGAYGSNTSTAGGAGGTGGGGAGAKFSTSNSTAGSGKTYGSGGGGTAGAHAAVTRTSGAGRQGVVIVRYGMNGKMPHVHVWGDWTTNPAPNCVTGGTRTRTCTAEDCTEPPAVQNETLSALGHDWGAWVTDVEPQIGVAGHRYHDCLRCGAHEEETLPPVSTDVTTNAMANASWGYEIRSLGDDYREVALVFTNATDKTMSWTVPDGVSSFRFLVVGGGGSGGGNGSFYGAGGGGAGGVVTGYLAQVTSGDLFSVSVGAGGQQTATGSNAGNKGKDSALASGDRQIVAYGGGGGGKNAAVGAVGGSGGGSGTKGGNGGSATAGKVTGFELEKGVASANGYFDAFGSSGGSSSSSSNFAGAGGGGAGGAGGNGTTATDAGKGGNGIICNLTGKDVRYAGGGGGGASYNNGKIGSGGAGGGGSGGGRTSNVPKPGTDGLGGGGGGGGGASDTSVYSVGAAGGSGVVVIRYTSAGDQPVPTPHEHVWGDWTTNAAPTCTEAGSRTRTCKADGCTDPAAVQNETIAALGHDWGAWVTDVEPQVGVAGHKYRDCSRCDAHEEEPVAPLQPVPTEVTTNAMANAAWGYEIRGLGAAMDEVALVFTNTTATMDYQLPGDVAEISYLLVGGGGGGGGGNKNVAYGRGGGGAGGVVTATVAVASRELTVKIGKGGAGRLATVTTAGVAAKGSDTELTVGTTSYKAYGGGGGGVSAAGTGGATVGCGGGGSNSESGGIVTSGQGCNGGNGGTNYRGGGGGGAGTPGTTPTSSVPGHGGDGIECAITGTSRCYAGGGAGSKASNADPKIRPLGGKGGGGNGGYSGSASGAVDGGDASYYGGGGGGAHKDGTGGNGYQGVVIVRYRTGGAPQPAGKWDEVEKAQIDGVTDANRAGVEATLNKIQAALPAGATSASVGEWLTTVYGNQKVSAATLANAKQVGISVKYDLPLLISETPTVTVEVSSDPVSETGVAAFVFTIMDGETPVPVTNAKVQAMVQYAATLAGGFAPSTAAEVSVTPDGTAIRAELQRVEGRSSGFMKIKLSEAEE